MIILNVAIIEDDFTLSQFLQKKIIQLENFNCSKTFFTVNEFLLTNEATDILLLDINLPGTNGIDAIPIILSKYPNVSIVMNTIKDDVDTIYKCLELGALGYIDKQSFNDNIAEVLETVKNGGAYMTPKIARKIINSFKKPKMPNLSSREQEVVNGILDGLTYLQIAEKYFITIDTVRSHIKNIYKKLSINSKAQLFKLYSN
ncbi:MAG: response regulator [Chitinophagaceae bacterium]|jgi:DNA-binding NarL/FixJ family response regulator